MSLGTAAIIAIPRVKKNQKLNRALTCIVRLGTVTLLMVEEPGTIAPLTTVS